MSELKSEDDLIDRLNEIRAEIRKYGYDIIPINNETANDHEQREFEVDTDRTAEWESYKRRQVIK